MDHLKYLLLTLVLGANGLLADKVYDNCKHRYSIVVDGGSSGTRLNVFKFEYDLQNLIINQTFIFKSKVALSSFSNNRDDWSLMRVMMKNLTDNARLVIPDQCVKQTPFFLQVTAGIRQIEQRMGSRILTHLKSILSKTGFKFQNDFVDVLSTTAEGQLAWISINFMLDNFKEKSEVGGDGDLKKKSHQEESRNTVGVLDLGGGSTQIAFATEHNDLIKKSQQIRVLGRDYYIYSQGYDYMGINQARVKYFNAQLNSDYQGKILRSKCLNPEVTTEYNIGNRTYLIGGQITRSGTRFCHCFGKALKFTKPVASIRQYFGTQKFVAISAYYYILKSAGNIFKINADGLNEANIKDIILRAMEICKHPKTNMKKSSFDHFLCMDLSYMVALLHNGYGFEWYDEIISSMKIKGINLSWALGYAISKF